MDGDSQAARLFEWLPASPHFSEARHVAAMLFAVGDCPVSVGSTADVVPSKMRKHTALLPPVTEQSGL